MDPTTMSKKKDKQYYLSWGSEEEYKEALNNYGDYSEEQSVASVAGRTFVGEAPNRSIKSDYHRGDYSYYRPSEGVPTRPKDIIKSCNKAYEKVGIIRQIIDLMSEFGCAGIRIKHEVPVIETFLNEWFTKVKGINRSERFMNLLYRLGTVVVNSQFGKVSIKDEKSLKKAQATDDDGVRLQKTKVNKRTIPLKYTFLSPLSIDIVGGEVASFVGKPIFALNISNSLKQEILNLERMSNVSGDEVKQLLSMIPSHIRNAIKKGAKTVPLDQTKISGYYYKKDDWNNWGNPMISSILDDLIMLEKMRLADLSALDGAISNVRHWTIGHLDGVNSILPTPSIIAKFRNVLSNSVGGGTLDLVTGPEISFTESNTQVYKFLGSEKYEPTLNAIYDGLGIPPTLRSNSNSGGNNSNNFVALKTFIERLEYGRQVLLEFWNEQLKIVQKAMGHSKPGVLVFDRMVLSDEAAEKQILLHMVDRDIISSDSLLEYFDFMPAIEKSKLKNELKKRGGNMPEKVSPFHAADKDHEYKKIVLQRGGVAPSEIGLELLPKKEGEESPNDQQMKMQLEVSKTKKENDGRPKNVTETSKRKEKPKPEIRSKANFTDLFIWANDAQKAISEIVTPAILHTLDKKNVRSLTKIQAQQLEEIKYGVLCNLEPFTTIDEKGVADIMKNSGIVPNDYKVGVKILETTFINNHGREATIDDIRQIQSSTYALIREENVND